MTRAQRARLGFFFLGVVALVVAAGLLLIGERGWRKPATYRVRFRESVSGLEISAAVRYQGLHVGSVSHMHVAADDGQVIEVALAIDPNVALYRGTTAQLDLSGLTGLKAVNLLPGDSRGPRLAINEVIPTSPGGFGHLADNAAAVIANVRGISDQLGALVNPNNRAKLEHLIGGIDTLVAHANRFFDDEQHTLGVALAEMTHTAHALGEAAEAATRLGQDGRLTLGRLEKSALATLAAVREPLAGIDRDNVRATLGSLHEASSLLAKRLSDKEAGNVIAAVGDTAERINRLVQDVDLAVRAGREDFAKSLSYLRQAAEDLREFSRILAQNPSVLVRGRNDAD